MAPAASPAGHPGAEENTHGEHDQDGRHGLGDALNDSLLHVLPAELEQNTETSGQEGRGDEQHLGPDPVDPIAHSEEKRHADERQEGGAKGRGFGSLHDKSPPPWLNVPRAVTLPSAIMRRPSAKTSRSSQLRSTRVKSASFPGRTSPLARSP